MHSRAIRTSTHSIQAAGGDETPAGPEARGQRLGNRRGPSCDFAKVGGVGDLGQPMTAAKAGELFATRQKAVGFCRGCPDPRALSRKRGTPATCVGMPRSYQVTGSGVEISVKQKVHAHRHSKKGAQQTAQTIGFSRCFKIAQESGETTGVTSRGQGTRAPCNVAFARDALDGAYLKRLRAHAGSTPPSSIAHITSSSTHPTSSFPPLLRARAHCHYCIAPVHSLQLLYD